jgi:hypothetical protein
MTRGMRHGSKESYKRSIWSRRNSQSKISSTDSDLNSSVALRLEMTLMAMCSRISGVERLSSPESSRPTSTTDTRRLSSMTEGVE